MEFEEKAFAEDNQPEPVPVIRTEADYYGASLLVARALGLSSAPLSHSTWVHGCDVLPVPRPAFTPMCDNKNQTHLVANELTAQWWRENGFTKVVAVGCPFIYTEPSGVARESATVLAMPNHRPAHCSMNGNDLRSWLEVVARLQPQYRVTVCVYEEEVEEKRPILEDLNLAWVTGARVESFSLPRMRALFDRFEFMVTDALGSHLAYAAWCGCRVSCMPPLYVRLWDNIKAHPHMQKYPQMKDNLIYYQESAMRERLPFLFAPTLDQVGFAREWANDVLGGAHKKEPLALARLLGWRSDDPAFEIIDYKVVAEWLGATNPDVEKEFLVEKIEKLKQDIKSLKTENKALIEENQKAIKQSDSWKLFRDSKSAVFACALYSIERRLRGFFRK